MEAILALAIALLLGNSPAQNQVNSDNTSKEKEIYNPSATRLSDVIHTNLAVSFNWEKQHLLGHAELTISPYFYSTNELILDAKGFDIHLINMNGKELSFEYDSLQLFIQLDREYQRNEKYTINIDYTAKPNDLKIEGSDACF